MWQNTVTGGLSSAGPTTALSTVITRLLGDLGRCQRPALWTMTGSRTLVDTDTDSPRAVPCRLHAIVRSIRDSSPTFRTSRSIAGVHGSDCPESRAEPGRASSALGLATILLLGRSPIARCSFGYKIGSKIASRCVSTPLPPCFVCCNPSASSWYANYFVGTGNDVCASTTMIEIFSQQADGRSSGSLGALSERRSRCFGSTGSHMSVRLTRISKLTRERTRSLSKNTMWKRSVSCLLSAEYAIFRSPSPVLFKTFIIQHPRRYTWIWQTNPTTTETF